MADYKTGDYKISDIYQGGYSGMKSPSGWSENNYVQTGSLGLTTDPRTANILKDVSSKLSSGIKNIEITGIQPEIFDSIPNQQLKEVHRLSKLTGVDVTLHGPLIEASGVTQQGFSESERELAQTKITQALLRSHELNPDGNIPVTFHSTAGLQGSQLLPPSKRGKGEGDYKKLIAINRETGRMAPLEAETKYYPGGKDGEVRKIAHIPEDVLESHNDTEWNNTLSQIEFNRRRVDEILKDVDPVTRMLYVNKLVAETNPKLVSKEAGEELEHLNQEQFAQFPTMHAASTYAQEARKSANAAFSRAWENTETEEDKKILQKISEQYSETLGAQENGKISLKSFDPAVQSQALYQLIDALKRVPPKVWIPIEKFAVEKSSETYGNAAFEAYKKFKDKSPVIVIENPPAGSGLSTGEDIKNIVEASRKQFVKKAVDDGMNESDAEKKAEKFIGATWDVGHINMLRAQGYSEADIVGESKKVAGVVKHVHLSDNFGMEHTELPMGMGNVPIKEIMEKLGEKGFEAKKIIEAGNWWQHWQASPFSESLEGLGSPIYSMKMAPYWNQSQGFSQGYMSGLDGAWLPQINYETFGGGFSKLSTELGGTAQGAQGSRMSGRGME
ncbi:MAG: hypothetical protein KJ905_03185 [Nanoarchaeota archaeon]|nr:hypothetical protein [Nanoarchaeota archaeon]MBU2458791.1 hypothetical protein [Nanoarchaeota archaeon]